MLQNLKIQFYELWGATCLFALEIMLFSFDVELFHLVVTALAFTWPFALFVPGIEERVESKRYKFSFYKMFYFFDSKCLHWLERVTKELTLVKVVVIRSMYAVIFIFSMSGFEVGHYLGFAILGGLSFIIFFYFWRRYQEYQAH